MLHNDAIWCHTFVLDFESATSWSVNYHGIPYADARKLDGVWWFRSPIGDRNILRFPIQDHVVPLFENPTVPTDSDRDALDELNAHHKEQALLGTNVTLSRYRIFKPLSSEGIIVTACPARRTHTS